MLPLLFFSIAWGQLSEKSCDELGWTDEVNGGGDRKTSAYQGQIGIEGVCGTGNEDQAVCDDGAVWTPSVCLGIGARLCTQEEYEALEAGDSGCGYELKNNYKYVWTSTECIGKKNKPGHIAIKLKELGTRIDSKCLLLNEDARGGRCCADVQTDSPTPIPNFEPTAAPVVIDGTFAPTLATPNPTACTPRDEPIDIYFLLDGSTSIKSREWGYLLDFVHDLIEIGINLPGDRIGVVQFSGRSKSRVEFTFGDGRDAVMNNVTMLDQMKGGTKTDEGVQMVIDSWKTEVDPEDSRDRTRIMMLVTDGVPNPASHSPCVEGHTQVKQLKKMKVETVIIGVDIPEGLDALDCMVRDPLENIVDIKDFTDFSEWRDPTDEGLICIPDGFEPLVSQAPTPAPTICIPRPYPIDVYFLLDGSKSISKENWLHVLGFVKETTKWALNIEGDRMGMVQFAGKPPVVEFTFDDGREYMMQNMLAVEQIRGGTRTDVGIQKVLTQWRTETPADDEWKPKLLVLITDGVPNPSSHNPCLYGHSEKEDLDDMHIETVLIGINMKPEDIHVLDCLVEDPETNIVMIDDFDDFSQWRDPTDEGLLCVPPGIFTDETFPPTSAPSVAPTEVPDTCPPKCGERGKLSGKASHKFSDIMSECECRDRCILASIDTTHFRYHVRRNSCSCFVGSKMTVEEYVVGTLTGPE